MKKFISLALTLVFIFAFFAPVNAVQAAAGTAPNIDTASSWARPSLNEAYAAGFIPAELLDNYKQSLTRAEACRLGLSFVLYVTGKTADQLLASRGLERNPDAFTDTDDPDILAGEALGIIKGIGNNLFGIDQTFDRQTSAMIMRNVCDVLGLNVVDAPASSYKDRNNVKSFFRAAVDYVTHEGIMQGNGDNFKPDEEYSREMGIISYVNLMKSYWYTMPGATVNPKTVDISKNLTPAGLIGDSDGNDFSYYINFDTAYLLMKPIVENIRVYPDASGQMWLDINCPELPTGLGWGFMIEFKGNGKQAIMRNKDSGWTNASGEWVYGDLPYSGKIHKKVDGITLKDVQSEGFTIDIECYIGNMPIVGTSTWDGFHIFSDCIFGFYYYPSDKIDFYTVNDNRAPYYDKLLRIPYNIKTIFDY